MLPLPTWNCLFTLGSHGNRCVDIIHIDDVLYIHDVRVSHGTVLHTSYWSQELWYLENICFSLILAPVNDSGRGFIHYWTHQASYIWSEWFIKCICGLEGLDGINSPIHLLFTLKDHCVAKQLFSMKIPMWTWYTIKKVIDCVLQVGQVNSM